MFFDTHAHLDDDRFDADREGVIESLKENGVELFINVGADMEGSRESVRLSEKYEFIYAAVGVHPHDVENMTEADIDELTALLGHEKTVALGEIGLDYYYDNSPRELQKKWFLRQLELGAELNVPVCVHCRDAMGDCLEIIKSVGYKKGVMHCFSGSRESAEELVRLGWYISFSGSLTFKNAKNLKEAASALPLDKIFIETDSPYLAPEPMRGKRNNPALVRYVAEELARLQGLDTAAVAAATMENAKKFFKIG